MVEASPSRANMGFIGAIVAVATIGGFLFGYDSGAVNGTQEGLKSTFSLIPGSWSPTNGLGFTAASSAPSSRGGSPT
jgi:SP family sugar:H+ symporter-like MFS transporter